jgi:ABC-2 type transport system permease protein
MAFSLLFKDELKGFYLSKVMIFLWIGLPVMAILLYLLMPDLGPDLSFTALSAMIVSSVAGTLGAVMLAVSIINEKNRHVYELFVIRPIKRRDIVLAKFFAVYICITIACIIAIGSGLAIDILINGGTPVAILTAVMESLTVSLSLMAISCSAGVLIGFAAPSILLGVILVIYGGNQISGLSILPTTLGLSNPVPFTVGYSAIITTVLLTLSIIVFNRRQF